MMCEVAGVARSSVYAQRQAGKATAGVATRRGPKTPWGDAELVERIRAVLAESPFVGEGYRKVWAKLRFAGIRTSKDRGAAPDARARTAGPETLAWTEGTACPRWNDRSVGAGPALGTDLTTTMTLEEGQAAVLLAVDQHTTEIVGIARDQARDALGRAVPVKDFLDTLIAGNSVPARSGCQAGLRRVVLAS